VRLDLLKIIAPLSVSASRASPLVTWTEWLRAKGSRLEEARTRLGEPIENDD
jgi:hypothetical protein